MTYRAFIEDYLAKGLIKRQKSDLKSAEKLILRAHKDLKTEAENAFDIAVKFVNLIKNIIKKENPQVEFEF